MHNLHYPKTYYDQYEAFERSLLVVSTILYLTFSGFDIAFSFNDMVCFKSKKIIDLWTFSMGVVTLLFYTVYYVLLCLATAPNTSRLYNVRLRLSYTIFHLLQFISNIGLMTVTVMSFRNMCNEWFEMYMWSKMGVLTSLSALNLCVMTFIGVYQDADTRDLIYVSTRRG
jgi:hypothetical protein